MRTVYLAALGVAFTTFSTGPAVAQDTPKVEPVAVPFKLLPSRHMLIELKLNGKGPFRVIFDTGAPLNLVNSKIAKAANLKGGGGGLAMLLSGPQVVEIEDAKLGSVSVEKLPVIVMDHPTVATISDAFKKEFGTIDGIVGFPLFARFITTVDYQKQELLLTPTDYKPGDYLKDLQANLTKAAEQVGPRLVGADSLWGFQVAAADDEEPGVVVSKVFPDSPAAKAGLKRGDRILTIDSRWTDTPGDAFLAASLVRVGREAEFAIRRDEESLTLKFAPVKGY